MRPVGRVGRKAASHAGPSRNSKRALHTTGPPHSFLPTFLPSSFLLAHVFSPCLSLFCISLSTYALFTDTFSPFTRNTSPFSRFTYTFSLPTFPFSFILSLLVLSPFILSSCHPFLFMYSFHLSLISCSLIELTFTCRVVYTVLKILPSPERWTSVAEVI